MALQQIIDITQDVNTETPIYVGGFDYVVVQFINPDGAALTFNCSNDAGAIEGVTDGGVKLATNFINIMGLDLADRVYKLYISENAIVKFDGGGQFLKFTNSLCDKAILRLYKI